MGGGENSPAGKTAPVGDNGPSRGKQPCNRRRGKENVKVVSDSLSRVVTFHSRNPSRNFGTKAKEEGYFGPLRLEKGMHI